MAGMESNDERTSDAATGVIDPADPPRDRLHRIARILLVPYLVVVALIVFSPAQDAARVTGFVWWAADSLASFGVPRQPAAVALEFTANVVLFAPIGLLARLAFDRVPVWMIIAAGCLGSTVIELVQLAIPSRVATVSDVIANTLGVALGAAFAVVARSTGGSRHVAG